MSDSVKGARLRPPQKPSEGRECNPMSLLRKGVVVFDSLVDFLGFLSGLLLVLLMSITCYAVVMRYIFHSPSGWVIEVCEYMLLYITFLGTTWLLKRDGHVKVDIVLVSLNPKVANVLRLVTSIMGAVSCAFLVVYGTLNTVKYYQGGTLVIQTLNTPKWILTAVIPFGSFLLVVQFLRQFIVLLHNSKK